MTVTTALWLLVALYALTTGIYLISENRRPQATIAWMLGFLVAPGLGLLVYLLFGRDRKAFSKENNLSHQNLDPGAVPLLAPVLARQESYLKELEDVRPHSRRLVMLVRNNSSSALVKATAVQIHQNADVFYPSLMQDMKAARHSIHHQYFIWGDDEVTRAFKDVMVAKARDGVAVRLLYDPVGSGAHLSRKYLRELEAAGVRVLPTSPLYRLHTISYRNHRKITVIDGLIGYLGGMNIGHEHIDGGTGFTSWRDTQVRLVGDGAAVLQAVFMVDWYNAGGEDLFSQDHVPVTHGSETEGVPVQILTSGPDSEWAAIRQLYSFMIASAQRRVFIQSPYFIPDATMAEALRVAAFAGVDVRVMISARSSGNPLPEWAGQTYMADVVAAGVRVYLYEAGYLHAKTISIDSEVCSIGSANIDIRSFSINYELNAVLYDPRLARELEQAFQRDLENCSEFTLEGYRARSRLARFRDSAARVLSPLL